MKQDLRSGSVDLITAGELGQSLHTHLGNHFSKFQRDLVAGMKVFKIPQVLITALATSFTLSAPVGSNPPGPDSGFIWRLERVNINASVLTDTAKYALYSGSDISPSPRTLIDNGNGGLLVNQAYYPGNNKGVIIWPGEQLYATLTGATVGNQYLLTGIVVEAPIEMQGKIIS